MGFRPVPAVPGGRVVAQIPLPNLPQGLVHPFLRRRVEVRILGEANQLRDGLLPQLTRQHAGVGQIAGGPFAKVVRSVVVKCVEQGRDRILRA